jgi:Domain of unknown function (DUF4431)
VRLARAGLAALLWASACTRYPPPTATSCLRYEPGVVRLSGVLELSRRYGPPGYGENPSSDQQLDVPILKLSRAVDVCADTTSAANSEAIRNVTQIQLIFRDPARQRMYAGRSLVATGTLFRAQSGRHFTPVVMTVRRVEAGAR